MAGDITLQTMTMARAARRVASSRCRVRSSTSGPAELNLTTGFPWTTGKVQATNPTAATIAGPRHQC